MMFLWCMGMRIGAVLDLKWADVDLEAGIGEGAGAASTVAIDNAPHEQILMRQTERARR